MCEICDKVQPVQSFSTPQAYLDCLQYIQALVDGGNFQFAFQDCDTDKVMDANGHWIDDMISHTIQCRNCGQRFTCTAVPYRGGGGFGKED